GDVQLVSIPRLEPDQPLNLQVARTGDKLSFYHIDNNVALANHFHRNPTQRAYVREISIENRSDLSVVKRLIELQVKERMLVEEILDAEYRLQRADSFEEAEWALQVMIS